MKTAYILPLALLMVPAIGAAQSLEKEITIDRDIVPEQRAAARPTVYPEVKTPQTRTINMKMQGNSIHSALSPVLFRLEPANTEPVFAATPWRGYLDLGYFPTVDAAVSAGYAILADEANSLNIWLQGDNRQYKGGPEAGVLEDEKFKSLDLAFGVDFAHRFNSYNTLKISASGAYSNWNVDSEVNGYLDPLRIPDGDNFPTNPDAQPGGGIGWYEGGLKSVHNFRFKLGAGFDGRYSDHLTYAVGAGFSRFANGKVPRVDYQHYVDETVEPEIWTTAPSASQSVIDFNGMIREQVNDAAAVSLNVEGKVLHYNSFRTGSDFMAYSAKGWNLPFGESRNMAQIDITPAAEYNSGIFTGRFGARFGISSNSGKTLHVAPDVLLGLNPDARFGLWVKLGGGVNTNTLEEIFQISRYTDMRMGYEFSNVAITGQVGLRVGPFYGASLTLTADYAAANDWLVPLGARDGVGRANLFMPEDLRSWKVGAKINWKYRKLLKLDLSYEGTLGDGNKKSWLYWADRAKSVIGASATVHPIDPLDVSVGFTARMDRSFATAEEEVIAEGYDRSQFNSYGRDVKVDLGTLTNLWAGASYRFTPAFSVFLRVDNILNNRNLGIFEIPAQGITGLAGISFKF